MTDAELDEMERLLSSLSSARTTSAHPFPMPSADAPPAPRTSLSRSNVPAPTTAEATRPTAKRSTKALSTQMRERKRQTSLLRRMKKKLENTKLPPRAASPSTRHTPAPTVFPFFPKRAHALATQATQTLTQAAPALATLPTQALSFAPTLAVAAPTLAVVAPSLAAALAPIDFAASLTSVNLSFNLASMSLVQGVEMVTFIYSRLFEQQYSQTPNDRMLYSANLWAMQKMAEDMGTQAQASTFGHWQQIAHSLIDQICTLV